MAGMISRGSNHAGLPPGTLEYSGEHTDVRDRIRIIEFNAKTVREREVQYARQVSLLVEPAPAAKPKPFAVAPPADDHSEVQAAVDAAATDLEHARQEIMDSVRPEGVGLNMEKTPVAKKNADMVKWVTVDGVHNAEMVKELGRKLDLHELITASVMDTTLRPKIEDLGQCMFVLLKWLSFDKTTRTLHRQQISLILGPSLVVTFKESADDVFEPLRERIRANHGRIRRMGADYLLYAVLDFLVDSYFIAFEQMDGEIDRLEASLAGAPDEAALHAIHGLRRQAIGVRKAVWPLRDVVGTLANNHTELISDETGMYFRDLHDHTVQVIEATESIREALSGLLDLYLSSVSNRMNSVMKVLTLIATIFIPLSFIAGVYGMNFHNIPGLDSDVGFWTAMAMMGLVAGGMLMAFRKKKWI